MKYLKLFFFITTFTWFTKLYSQDIYIGYSYLHQPTLKRSVSVIKYRFEKDIDTVTKQLDFTNNLKGFSFGINVPASDFMRITFDYRRNTQKVDGTGEVSGSRFYPNGTKYLEVKYTQSAFGFNIYLGPDAFSIGYGFEFARFKRKDKTLADGEWDKRVRSKNFYVMPMLSARIKLGDPGKFGILIQPSWRFSKAIHSQENSIVPSYREYFSFNSLGGTIGICIPITEK